MKKSGGWSNDDLAILFDEDMLDDLGAATLHPSDAVDVFKIPVNALRAKRGQKSPIPLALLDQILEYADRDKYRGGGPNRHRHGFLKTHFIDALADQANGRKDQLDHLHSRPLA